MIQIFKKEIHAFFSSLVGYIAILVFLLLSGFLLWIAPDQNILDFGYASMDRFFSIAPWVLLLLIPAITMRLFSDEFKSGTIEILYTLPLQDKDIILGKFLAGLALTVFALVPTLLYIITLSSLSVIPNNLDTGGIIGSYLGLLFLAAAYTSVGLFCSSMTNNQVVAFLIAVFINFILFNGFESISKLNIFKNGLDYWISYLGMQSHYHSISRGLIDSKDVIYFLSVIIIFMLLTHFSLQKRKLN